MRTLCHRHRQAASPSATRAAEAATAACLPLYVRPYALCAFINKQSVQKARNKKTYHREATKTTTSVKFVLLAS